MPAAPTPAPSVRLVPVSPYDSPAVSARDAGFLVGLLVGEGHFGGDGRQPQATLRMHVRHAGTFHWLVRTIPGGKLYGPYSHGGRHYYQWMSRGRHLSETVVPLVLEHADLVDDHVWQRFTAMLRRYGLTTLAADEMAQGLVPPS